MGTHQNFESHENVANTKFINEFWSRLKALNRINNYESIDKVFVDLLYIALEFDYVTNDKTVNTENEFISLLQELDDAIKNCGEEEVRDVIEESKNALLERNVLCRTGE